MDKKINHLSDELKKQNKGFTVIELLVVVTILAILGTLVSLGLFSYVDKAKKTTASTQIKTLESALQLYKLSCGEYPTSDQGLEVLVTPPTIGKECKDYPEGGLLEKKKLPKDPWGMPFQYIYPGEKNPNSFDLWSLGKDGNDGSEDDIGNWEESEGEEK